MRSKPVEGVLSSGDTSEIAGCALACKVVKARTGAVNAIALISSRLSMGKGRCDCGRPKRFIR